MATPLLDYEISGTEQRTWNVQVTLPKNGDEHQYRRNRTFCVACETFMQAVTAAMELHPGATIWSVSHGQKIVIVQPKCATGAV